MGLRFDQWVLGLTFASPWHTHPGRTKPSALSNPSSRRQLHASTRAANPPWLLHGGGYDMRKKAMGEKGDDAGDQDVVFWAPAPRQALKTRQPARKVPACGVPRRRNSCWIPNPATTYTHVQAARRRNTWKSRQERATACLWLSPAQANGFFSALLFSQSLRRRRCSRVGSSSPQSAERFDGPFLLDALRCAGSDQRAEQTLQLQLRLTSPRPDVRGNATGRNQPLTKIAMRTLRGIAGRNRPSKKFSLVHWLADSISPPPRLPTRHEEGSTGQIISCPSDVALAEGPLVLIISQNQR
ncbi:hypothetical protein QBC34DRAFT_207217 [Podospora aff. communis PSN243]|uniref:Uncharacterized protein n=1 Tax=Podospora aff. communis PSN243 TaxID=3040156 RepID=A0AAV9H1C9_9PEZI|nr:hypothetical protein QBC34DRAFT_207217 [Podospora aff. communis PSN243]